MSDIVIRAEGLGKRYRRGVVGPPPTLRDTMTRFIKSPVAAIRQPTQEHFWALRDVGLEVRHGEVLGLIGRNGAGKTTLLKILSRITRPTTGWAEIHGRVRSLLEVGTGFHGELSGRENTYLSGSILGMSKREIDRKFDEIVAFAEIDKFIDTPVKHYSSGMYVRLAFAVAAHLEPEILLVDEVLAVGDINFQKKCLGKMGDVAAEGRTIVLVSHQMNQMRRLCHRAVWIDGGKIRRDGNAQAVISSYESSMSRGDRSASLVERDRSMKARFIRWEIDGSNFEESHTLDSLNPVTINFYIETADSLRRCEHGIALYNAHHQLMWASAVADVSLEIGTHALSHTLPILPLRPGPYHWQVSLLHDKELLDLWDCLPEMNITTPGHQHYMDEWNGILNIPSEFSVEGGLSLQE
jgi:lipopolysaccharide transport system ATP-binding protein